MEELNSFSYYRGVKIFLKKVWFQELGNIRKGTWILSLKMDYEKPFGQHAVKKIKRIEIFTWVIIFK